MFIRFSGKRGGFTLTEILIVIGIITLLAGIVYPVLMHAKAKSKETQCITKMMRIYEAARLFESEQHKPADFIVVPVMQYIANNTGPVEPYDPTTCDATVGRGAVPLNMTNGIVNGEIVALYPEYLQNTSDLRCPYADMPGPALGATDAAAFVLDPVFTYYTDYAYGGISTGASPSNIENDPLFVAAENDSVDCSLDVAKLYRYCNYKEKADNPPDPGDPKTGYVIDPKPYYLYKYCSYEYEKVKGGGIVDEFQDEAHYCTAWMYYNKDDDNNDGVPDHADPDVEKQMRWRNPTEDTVITWCSYHRVTGPRREIRDSSGTVYRTSYVTHGSQDFVLFYDGHVGRMASAEMDVWTNGWRVKMTE